MPPTPPSRVMNIVSDNLFEEGYDSYGQMGPFYEQGVSDEEFFTMTEDEPVREIEVTAAPRIFTWLMCLCTRIYTNPTTLKN